ncbi:MAG TPA: hypothetical protein VHG51_07520 [Longimicrobiaceae bacterium]|nr:hypothetical protein [Longimicrobiaceae bacterium]
MESITSWTRLEPRTRSDDLGPALQARVHDPLWLIARQWQLGELTGEDAGSPAWVRVRADVAPLTGWIPGDGARRDYDRSLPLEALAEREPGPDPALDLALAAEAGLHWLRLLSSAGLSRYRAVFTGEFPLPEAEGLDPASARAVGLLRGRAPDGNALLSVLRAAAAPDGTFPDALEIAEPDLETVREAAGRWVAWWDGLYSRAQVEAEEDEDGAWEAERMEYRFAVTAAGATDGEVVLQAPEYHGGRLDWYDFVHSAGAELQRQPPGVERVRTVLPAAAAYPGMPVARWWEFEDARTDFGRVEAEPADLARLLVVEYATVYSNDWFLVPLELPVGAVCGVRSVVVGDTFGQKTLVRAAGTDGSEVDSWSLFRPSRTEGGVSSLFFLAPTLPPPLESPPVEEVRFLRDEMANLAWAVERRVESRTGRPIDRHEAWAARHAARPPAPPPAPGAPLVYRLATEVPEHWFPLVPIPDPEAPGAMRLRRLDTQRREGDELETLAPLGRVLVPATLKGDERLEVREEEVPREGIRVLRSWQHARWTDGSTHVWIGRRKLPGLGEGSAGLRFDTADPAPRPG